MFIVNMNYDGGSYSGYGTTGTGGLKEISCASLDTACGTTYQDVKYLSWNWGNYNWTYCEDPGYYMIGWSWGNLYSER